MMNQTMTLGDANLISFGRPDRAQQNETTRFDYELAQRIATGDMQAFEEFYRRYHRRVYTLCLRMTNNTAEAEDLTQEIFIHVYSKLGGFRGESTMTTWLHRVTVNIVLMHFRKSARRRELMTEDGDSPEPVLEVIGLSTRTPILDRIAIERAVTQLPPGYRAVLILHDVEGYEHSEIARMCGISSGTSKSQLHKARKRLHVLLKGASRAEPEGGTHEPA